MKRKIIVTISMMVFGLFGVLKAQTVNQILEKAEQSLYGSAETTKISFTSSMYMPSNNNANNVVNGSIILQDENFRLTYGDILATFHKGVLSYFDKNQNTLNFSEPSNEELIMMNPLYFIRSKAKGFKITKDAPTKAGETLMFTPTTNMNIKEISTVFHRKQGFPTDIIIKGKDGSRVVIKIVGVERLKPKHISYFELEASQYPNAEIVDLR